MTVDFIYPIVEPTSSITTGRPSVDSVVLGKMMLIHYLFGLRSMRQTSKARECNVSYRWLLGDGLTAKVPHFTTVGKMTVTVSPHGPIQSAFLHGFRTSD